MTREELVYKMKTAYISHGLPIVDTRIAAIVDIAIAELLGEANTDECAAIYNDPTINTVGSSISRFLENRRVLYSARTDPAVEAVKPLIGAFALKGDSSLAQKIVAAVRQADKEKA